MKNTARFRQNSDFLYREIVGESLLVPTGETSKQFSGMGTLNQTGTFLWKLLEEEHSLQELSELFAREYELDEEQSLQDVAEFLAAAQTCGAVIEL